MNFKYINILARNDLVLLKKNRLSFIQAIIGIILLFASLVSLMFFPIVAPDDLDPDLFDSIKDRNPEADNPMLIRLALSITVIPGLLMFPVAMAPGLIALTSLTSEKEQNTLESIFLLPLSDGEILFAKLVMPVLTTVAGTWAVYFLTGILCFIIDSSAYIPVIFNGALLFEVLLLVPGLSILSALGGIIISINTADSISAQRISIIPGTIPFAIAIALIFGTILSTNRFLVIMFIVISLLNALGLLISFACFKREKIFLRY